MVLPDAISFFSHTKSVSALTIKKAISMQTEMTPRIYFCPEDEINFSHFVQLLL